MPTKRQQFSDNRLERQIRRNEWADEHNISLPSVFNKRYREYIKTPIESPRRVDVSVYGSPIPLSYGTFRHKCHIIWSTDLTPYTVDLAAQGLTVDPDDAIQQRWKASWAVKICKGEQGPLLRVYFNKKCVFDYSAEEGDGYNSTPNLANKIKYYPGSATQTANPTIEAEEGVGNVQAYRGTAYIVFTDVDLGPWGNELPEVEAEVSASSTPNYTTYNVTDFPAATANVENFIVSRSSNKLYHFTPDSLTVVRRQGAVISRTVNIQEGLDNIASGCTIEGKIAIDEVGGRDLEPVYFICEETATSSAFILRYDSSFTSNYADRISGVELDVIFVSGSRLYAADETNNRVLCYDKTTLALLWIRNGPQTGLEVGNFTVDNSGLVWLVWFNPSDDANIYLTRMSAGGGVKNFVVASLNPVGAKGIIYDTVENVFLTGGVDDCRISKISNTVPPVILAEQATSKSGSRCRPLFTSQYRCAKSSYWCDGTNIYRVKHSTLAIRETIALSNYADVGTGLESYGYGYTEKSFWICRDDTPALSKLPLNRFDTDSSNLDDIVSDLCLRAGLESTDFDVTALAGGTVSGFVVPNRVAAKDPLQVLMDAFQLGVREHFESGDQIKLEFFFRADQSSVVSITEGELGVGEDEPEEQLFLEEKINEEDIAQRVNVRYADVKRAYDSHVQKDSIPLNVTTATRQLNMDFPDVVMTDDQAKQLACRVLAVSWEEDTTCFFTAPIYYSHIEPEDVVTVTYSGVDRVVRIETVEEGANMILQFSCVKVSPEAYVSVSEGSIAPPAINPVRVVTESLVVLVDSPPVRDVDGQPDDAGFYGFSAPQIPDPDWIGSRLSRSKDGVSPFALLATFLNKATIGVCTTILGDRTAGSFGFEETSTVTVRVISGVFGSESEETLYTDENINLCAIGSEENGWEIVQFAEASGSGDTITLTGMLRGRFGTERFCGTHQLGEYVCLFDFTTPTTKRVKLPLSDRNLESIYRISTIGGVLSSAASRTFTNTAQSLTPFPILEESITWEFNEPAADDVTVNFLSRNRIGFQLQDYYDQATSEEALEFEVEIRDSPTGDIERTITVGPGLPETTGINLAISASTVTRGFGSGSFLLEGFLVGQYVDLAGWATATNNYRFQITALSALVMTLSGPLTNEATGAGRTVKAATPAFCYTAAQQVEDGGVKASFYATFYQISQRLRENDETGRGPGVQVHIS